MAGLKLLLEPTDGRAARDRQGVSGWAGAAAPGTCNQPNRL